MRSSVAKMSLSATGYLPGVQAKVWDNSLVLFCQLSNLQCIAVVCRAVTVGAFDQKFPQAGSPPTSHPHSSHYSLVALHPWLMMLL